MTAPLPVSNGYKAVLQAYGNIHRYIRSDGTLSPRWEAEKITRVALPAPLPYAADRKLLVTRVTAHVLIAEEVRGIFREIHRLGLWDALETYGGGFVFRPIRGSVSSLSMHSFGIAYDFDVADNPLGSTKEGTMHPAIIGIFRARGWLWGGDYKDRKDPMHFQRATGA